MINAEKISTVEDYLAPIDESLEKSDLFVESLLLREYYESLKSEFRLILENSKNNTFLKIAELLRIDAQFQIMVEFCTNFHWSNFELEEEGLVELIRNDCQYFYRELSGLTMHHQPPWGLIYLSERV
ncbi:hypothetical protein IGJ74_000828 [Enterococcus sp. AZ009]|uniref:DUF7006 family protein n=1 Tax=Enterococcus TaxID=1350 RepID=UPI001C48EE4F|nr:hypothetical protein [Enterococcus casseliflavus]